MKQKIVCCTVLVMLVALSNVSASTIARSSIEQKGLKATNQPSSDVAAQKARLIVSFYSIGTGINSQARNRFIEYISRYEKAKAVKLAKEEVHWGREGEVDYCLQLKEIRPKERQKFILKIRSLLKNAKYVRIEENAPCKNMR